MDDRYCWGCMGPRNGFEKCSCGFDEGQYSIESYHLKPGSMINNKYYIGKVLGEGGFGITYIGRDRLHRKVAIKEFYMQGYANRDNAISAIVSPNSGDKKGIFNKYKESFLNEGKTMACYERVEGIVRIYDCELANNTVYLIMEYIEGETLQQYCKRIGHLSVEFAIDMLKLLINSIEPLHNDNIVHRDISPQNIMIRNGKPILLDFGNAREFEIDNEKTSTVILKQGYAPTEQYLPRGKVGPWSDIYSLCATVYYGMTGLAPGEDINHNKSKRIIPISTLVSDIPSWFEDILDKGLKEDYEERFQNISELREAIYEAKEQQLPKNGSFNERTGQQLSGNSKDTTVILDSPTDEDIGGENKKKTEIFDEVKKKQESNDENDVDDETNEDRTMLVVVMLLIIGLIVALVFLLIVVNASIRTRENKKENTNVQNESVIENDENIDEKGKKEKIVNDENVNGEYIKDESDINSDYVYEDSGSTEVMTTDSVRMREGPSTDTQQVAIIDKGEILECIDFVEADGYPWYKVKYNGDIGYIRGDFAEIK